MMERSNAYQKRQIRYECDQKMLPIIMRARYIRQIVPGSQNFFTYRRPPAAHGFFPGLAATPSSAGGR